MWRDLFVTVAQLIVASPRAWKELKKEEKTESDFLSHFLHPLFGIIALATFIGGLWFTREGDLESALKSTIITVVAVYGGYFIASYVMNELAYRFGLEKNLPRFQQFVGYASVVLYALYVIIPFLSDFFILWILVLYTIHLVNMGAKFFIRVPEKGRVNFVLLVSALVVFTPVLIQSIFSLMIQ
ncbi:MAG: DUF1282 family protein [Proteiniphilum sp.]|jgi:hypothetical protein|nr:DUF1282 family protein [Proteiniphilum sp.]